MMIIHEDKEQYDERIRRFLQCDEDLVNAAIDEVLEKQGNQLYEAGKKAIRTGSERDLRVFLSLRRQLL